MKTREEILEYLRMKKDELKEKHGIIKLGLFGSYARNEAKEFSDIDIFYEKEKEFKISSGFEFLRIADTFCEDLGGKKVDFVCLEVMNPIIRHYAERDFIYV